MRSILIMDASSILQMTHFRTSPSPTAKGADEAPAINGFLRLMAVYLERLEPGGVVVAFDSPAGSVRQDELDVYRYARLQLAEPVLKQIPLLKTALEDLEIPFIEVERFEGSDVIASIVEQCAQKRIHTYVVTRDEDILQLVSKYTDVFLQKPAILYGSKFGLSSFPNKYANKPSQIPDMKAILGDSANKVPGIPGISRKAASRILHMYGDIEAIFEDKELRIGTIEDFPFQENLTASELAKDEKRIKAIQNEPLGRQKLAIGKRLATLIRDVELPMSPEDFYFTEEVDVDKLISEAREYVDSGALHNLCSRRGAALALNDEQILRFLTDTAYSVVEIAKRTGKPLGEVIDCQHALYPGMPIRVSNKAREKKCIQRAIEMINNGGSVEEASIVFGLSPSEISAGLTGAFADAEDLGSEPPSADIIISTYRQSGIRQSTFERVTGMSIEEAREFIKRNGLRNLAKAQENIDAINKVVNLYRDGMPMEQIAKETGTNLMFVKDVVAESECTIEEAIAIYERGKVPAGQLKRVTGYTLSEIKQAIQKKVEDEKNEIFDKFIRGGLTIEEVIAKTGISKGKAASLMRDKREYNMRRAIEMRKEGASYDSIKQKTGIGRVALLNRLEKE